MRKLRLANILAALFVAGSLTFHVFPATAHAADAATVREIVVTQDLTLDKDATLDARLVIQASGITIDGNGATLVGPGAAGKLESFQGNGIAAEGCRDVTIRNLKVKGFAAGLVVVDGEAWRVENCDFSDNYHDPDHGWGDGPRQGGILLTRVGNSVLRGNHANRVWNGLDLNELARQPHRRQRFLPLLERLPEADDLVRQPRSRQQPLLRPAHQPRRGPRPRLDLRADRERLGRQLLLPQRHHPRRRRPVHPRAQRLGLARQRVRRERLLLRQQQLRRVLEPGQHVHPQQGQPRSLRFLARRQRPDGA